MDRKTRIDALTKLAQWGVTRLGPGFAARRQTPQAPVRRSQDINSFGGSPTATSRTYYFGEKKYMPKGVRLDGYVADGYGIMGDQRVRSGRLAFSDQKDPDTVQQNYVNQQYRELTKRMTAARGWKYDSQTGTYTNNNGVKFTEQQLKNRIISRAQTSSKRPSEQNITKNFSPSRWITLEEGAPVNYKQLYEQQKAREAARKAKMKDPISPITYY